MSGYLRKFDGKVKAFIGIPASLPLKNKINGVINEFKKDFNFSYVDVKKLHYTLLFLGDINYDEAVFASEKIKDAAENMEPFYITASNLGVFNSLHNPKVLWLGINEGKEEMNALHLKLKNELENRFKLEKREFQPHLTFARVRIKIKNKQKFIAVFNKADDELKEEKIKVDKAVLYKSEKGEYIPLFEQKLKGE